MLGYPMTLGFPAPLDYLSNLGYRRATPQFKGTLQHWAISQVSCPITLDSLIHLGYPTTLEHLVTLNYPTFLDCPTTLGYPQAESP